MLFCCADVTSCAAPACTPWHKLFHMECFATDLTSTGQNWEQSAGQPQLALLIRYCIAYDGPPTMLAVFKVPLCPSAPCSSSTPHASALALDGVYAAPSQPSLAHMTPRRPPGADTSGAVSSPLATPALSSASPHPPLARSLSALRPSTTSSLLRASSSGAVSGARPPQTPPPARVRPSATPGSEGAGRPAVPALALGGGSSSGGMDGGVAAGGDGGRVDGGTANRLGTLRRSVSASTALRQSTSALSQVSLHSSCATPRRLMPPPLPSPRTPSMSLSHAA